MSPRAGGVLALIAAVLLVVTVLTPWWSGAPTVDGHAQHVREVNVTLFGGEGCNVEGDETCQRIPLGGGFKTVEVIELLLVVATVLGALALGGTALAGSALRKKLSRVVLATGAATLVVAIVLVVMSPDVIAKGHDVTVPTGVGAFLAMGASAVALAGSALARRDAPPRTSRPRLSVAPVPTPQAAMGGASQPFDVQALLREDVRRPADRKPEPMRPPPSPGGALVGPSGPLQPVNGQAQAPLFSSAPQLRPLYEMPGAGFVPPPQPPLPMRAPTPIPRSTFDARPDSDWDPPAPPPPPVQPPPLPPAQPAVDAFGKTALDPGARRPPPPRRAGLPSPTRPPPPPPPAPPRASIPTPPPLGLPTPPFPTATPPVPVDEVERADTDLPEDSFDGAETRQPLTDEVPLVEERPPTAELRSTTEVGDHTDAGIIGFAQDDSTSPGEPRAPTDGDDDDAEEISTKGLPSLPPKTEEDALTRPVERESLSVIASTPKPPPTEKVPTIPPPIAAVIVPPIVVKPPMAIKPPVTVKPTPTAKPAPAPSPAALAAAVAAAPEPAKVPITTAPQNMPPPKATQTPPPSAGPSPACPQCESPMAWVEEHLRFYCKSCKMYF